MSQKANNVKLGVFIMTGTVVFVGVLVLLGAGSMFEKKTVFETYYDTSVQGLDIGSPVKFRGVQLGKVAEIGFVQDYYPDVTGPEAQNVLIRMEIEQAEGTDYSDARMRQRMQTYIDNGMRLQLASQGITGLAFIQADYLDENAPPPIRISWEPSIFYIPSAPNVITEITKSIESIARDLENAELDKIAKNVDEMVTITRERIEELDLEQLSKDLSESMANANHTLEVIDEFVSHPEMQNLRETVPETVASIREAVDNMNAKVDAISGELEATLSETRGVITDVQEKLDSEEMDRVMEMADSLADDLPRLIADLDSVVLSVDSTIGQNSQEVRDSIDNIRAATSDLRDLATTLRQYPSLGLMGEAPPQLEAYE